MDSERGGVPERAGFYRLLFHDVEPWRRDDVKWRICREDWAAIRRTFPPEDVTPPLPPSAGPLVDGRWLLLGRPVELVDGSGPPELVIVHDRRSLAP